jgi:hypothetical protein
MQSNAIGRTATGRVRAVFFQNQPGSPGFGIPGPPSAGR